METYGIHGGSEEVSKIPEKSQSYFIIDYVGYVWRPTLNKDNVV